MLDNFSCARTPGVAPNPDFWTISATSGTTTVSLKLINVANLQQFQAAITKLLTLLDAAANIPATGWTIDATKF